MRRENYWQIEINKICLETCILFITDTWFLMDQMEGPLCPWMSGTLSWLWGQGHPLLEVDPCLPLQPVWWVHHSNAARFLEEWNIANMRAILTTMCNFWPTVNCYNESEILANIRSNLTILCNFWPTVNCYKEW